MELICPIDASCSHQISALLNPPSPPKVQKYYEELVEAGQSCGLEVRTNGEYGKGVYAKRDFKIGDLVLKDPMLFGIQHPSNKMDCLVCSHCFQFIGSVELQIGRKLYLRNLVDVSGSNNGKMKFSSGLKDCGDQCDQDDSDVEDDDDMGQCGSSNSENDCIDLPKDIIDSLMNGGLKLPYSNVFSLPSVVSCPGGCKEAFYCRFWVGYPHPVQDDGQGKFKLELPGPLCATADWNLYHSLLCTGKGSKSLSTEALSEFIQHANETNDIFLLAAKVISFTILRYRKLKTAQFEEKEKFDTRSPLSTCNLSLLLEAWEPVSMGYKRRWWDCISLPDDVDCHDEAAFRLQIKELAFTACHAIQNAILREETIKMLFSLKLFNMTATNQLCMLFLVEFCCSMVKSLQLLKAAMFDKECEPLFSLEIYGHIIGMFELNNLDLIVESPVENYFLHIDDLPGSEKEEAEQVTRPFLDALGDDYSNCCEGTAFFPLQSCMNHSCNPNAKAFKREEDRDGQATLIAVQPIHTGEEVTISYIDEELPYEERQSLLADYGFRCRCPKCLDEEPSS